MSEPRGPERVFYHAWRRAKPGTHSAVVLRKMALEEISALRSMCVAKRCSKCHAIKLTGTDFARDATGSWCWDNYCKICRKAMAKDRRRKHREETSS